MSSNFKTIRQGINLPGLSSDPSGGAVGDLFYSSFYNAFRYYNGTLWKTVGSGGGGGTKNYLSAITTSSGTNTGNGDFELGSTTGWSLAHSALTQSFPSTVTNAGAVFTGSQYLFTISSGSANAGATYTNNAQTFTVVNTISSGATLLACTGTGAPTSSGTLSLASGSGSATLNFTSFIGTAASTNLSLSVVSSGSGGISGNYSGQYASSTTNVTGDMMISDAFYIDRDDMNNVLTITGAYEFTAESGVIFAGDSTSTFGLAIYDVTNGVWIQPSSVWVFTTASGVAKFVSSFQTSSSLQYQFAIYNSNSTSGNFAILLDEISIGPAQQVIGAAMSDWQSYTPTFVGFGTVSSVNFYSRRVGANLEVFGSFTSGTSTAVPASITLGYAGGNGNVNIAASDLTTSSQSFGTGYTSANTTSTFGIIASNGATNFFSIGVAGASSSALGVANGSAIAASGQVISISASFPIVGWSSNVQMSSSLPTGVVSWNGTQSSQSVTGGTTDISFTSVIDRTGSWNGTQFVVPTSGDYIVNGQASTSASGVIAIYKNGTLVTNGYFSSASASVSAGSIFIPGCIAGDKISIRCTTSVTVESGNIGIFMLPNTSMVLASPSVNARYSGTSSSVGTAQSLITFTTKTYDTSGSFSGSTFTAPTIGKYSVKSVLGSAGITLSVNQVFHIFIYHNGSSYSNIYVIGNGASNLNYMVQISDTVPCIAGDTIQIYAACSVATSANTGYITIDKVG